MKRTGKTTRMIDRCVQELFSKGVTFIYERDVIGEEKKLTDDAYARFTQRMENEHIHIKTKDTFGVFSGIYCWKVELLK